MRIRSWRGRVGGPLAAVVFLSGLAALPTHARDGEADKALADIMGLGGRIERDDKAADKPIIGINLGATAATDATLDELKSFDKVRRLLLNGTKITDAGLEKLKGLGGLQKLYLVDTKITDAGLEHLKGLSELQVLSIVGTQVTDAGLEHLKGLSKLESLFVFGTKVTEAGAKKLQESIPKLKVER